MVKQCMNQEIDKAEYSVADYTCTATSYTNADLQLGYHLTKDITVKGPVVY